MVDPVVKRDKCQEKKYFEDKRNTHTFEENVKGQKERLMFSKANPTSLYIHFVFKMTMPFVEILFSSLSLVKF